MKIICNGEDREITPGSTVESLLNELGLDPDGVVVELNGKIVLREEYTGTLLNDGSALELIRFVGGG